ncbi:MAG: hypothetical protein KDJ31_01680 [Candidatus Competibacteraceae bacterium]|nr:hypothetical protein [Candidatus Competibacteraceae bacterium]
MSLHTDLYNQIKVLMSGDEVRTAISFAAFAVSLASVYFSRRSWFQSNRPIVIAFVEEQHTSDIASTFKLVVSNTGNRPATNVCLRASSKDLSALVEQTARPEWKDAVNQCFSESAIIPVLRNGEELSTAFGAYTPNSPDGEWLNYGVQIKITIKYSDLDGHNYKSIIPLKIYVREGFGGSIWSSMK